jgi:hypothetical protein
MMMAMVEPQGVFYMTERKIPKLSSSSSATSSQPSQACNECPNGAAYQLKINFGDITNNVCADCMTVWNKPPANVITFSVGNAPTCVWMNLFDACETSGNSWLLIQDTPLGQSGTWWVLTLTSSSTITQYYCSLANFNCLGTSIFTHGYMAGNDCNFPATITLSPV